MSWFWCVQNKHTRGREQKREKGGACGGCKRGIGEMERTGGEEEEREDREDCRRGKRKEEEKVGWRKEERREI